MDSYYRGMTSAVLHFSLRKGNSAECPHTECVPANHPKLPMQTELIFEPTETHLDQLRGWLKAEIDEGGWGFFCNWCIIERSFHDEELFCIAANGIAIGFLVWTKRDYEVRLDICEVHPEYRQAGLGRRLVEASLAKFEGGGALVAELECQPPTSEPFWRKMGFLDFPSHLEDPYLDSGIELYCPLKPATRPNEKSDCEEVLELWACEPWNVENKSPAWTWEIVREPGSTRLSKPIIFPCSREWNLRWRKHGLTLAEGKVKYFSPTSLGGYYLVYTHLDFR